MPFNKLDLLQNNGYDIDSLKEDEVVFFDGFDFNSALIGMTLDNKRAVYDYDLMLEWLIENENMSLDEAIEYIDFNLPNGIQQPIVLCRFDEYK